VLAIQETKVEDDKFPRTEFEELGYELALNGQKSWNGVALVSRLPIENVRRGFGDDLMPEDARIVSATIAGVEIVNTYVPNGSAVGSEKWGYKMRWMERFARYLRERYTPEAPLLWLGDVNVAPNPIDVHDSPRFYGGVGHHPDEFARLDRILEWGLTDAFRQLHPEAIEYSFFDFTLPRALDRNLGWRIDHIYLSSTLLPSLERAWIDRDARAGEKPSDHTYVVCDLDL
ncbi:exodeoxyribonuclease III, partial [bacterium]